MRDQGFDDHPKHVLSLPSKARPLKVVKDDFPIKKVWFGLAGVSQRIDIQGAYKVREPIRTKKVIITAKEPKDLALIKQSIHTIASLEDRMRNEQKLDRQIELGDVANQARIELRKKHKITLPY